MVMAWALERIEPEKQEEWMFLMSQPLPDEEPTKVTPAQVEDEGSSFLALMSQMQGSSASG